MHQLMNYLTIPLFTNVDYPVYNKALAEEEQASTDNTTIYVEDEVLKLKNDVNIQHVRF